PKELLDPLLMPMDTAVEDLPEVNLNAELTDLVQHGMPVQVAGAPAEGTVRMTSGEEKLFVGVAQIAEDGRVAPKRLVVFRDEEPQA
ncbi:MAG TPA: tRNA pseudouridine(55) synthase TruB, partial [Vibrio sp.]|nr:tRNA pseudouridine(55) synthase TruB [Vibrio sp.]